jgi:hypothetical protein
VFLLREATSSGAVTHRPPYPTAPGTLDDSNPFSDVIVPWPEDKALLTMEQAAYVEWTYVRDCMLKVTYFETNPISMLPVFGDLTTTYNADEDDQSCSVRGTSATESIPLLPPAEPQPSS